MFEVLLEVLGEILFVAASHPAEKREPLHSAGPPRPVPPPTRSFGPHNPPDPALGISARINFAPGSTELDADAQALLDYARTVYDAQPIGSIALDASYDRREVESDAVGRALARARAKTVQDVLENGGLSVSYFTRVRGFATGPKDPAGRGTLRRVRIELPLRLACRMPKPAV